MIKEVDKDTFFATIPKIEYREDDEKEAVEYGTKGVVDCYYKSVHEFNKYFIAYEDNKPICPILLGRNGYITFFISKDVNKPLPLIKELKDLARKTVDCCGPIVTKTASWYKEALRLNKLIGFKKYKLYNQYGFYILR
jgi:hypothetical protein